MPQRSAPSAYSAYHGSRAKVRSRDKKMAWRPMAKSSSTADPPGRRARAGPSTRVQSNHAGARKLTCSSAWTASWSTAAPYKAAECHTQRRPT